MSDSRVFFVVGPTAIGKSALAVAVAEECGAEIINADAFQVYAGLDLLTAKPSFDLRRRVPHHLIGVIPTSESFSVARFLDLAREHLARLAQGNRPALVVGGTGLYIKALTHGLAPLPPAQPEIRARLDTLTTGELVARLERLDPASAARIDCNNRRRLIRAIEVCLITGTAFSEHQTQWQEEAALEMDRSRGVYLTCPRSELHARIARRVAEMFRSGVVEEVAHSPDYWVGPTATSAIGLAEIRTLLRGEISSAECQRQIEAATRQYAKRQITWFKRESIFERVELASLAGESLETAARVILEKMRVTPAQPQEPQIPGKSSGTDKAEFLPSTRLTR